MNNPRPIKIVLADNYYFRKGLKISLSEYARKEIDIIAEADNGLELLDVVKTYKPDIVIIGLHLPLLNGLDACKEIIKNFPEIGIIAMSMLLEIENIHNMHEAGAKAYLPKFADTKEIIEAIQNVNAGEVYYSQHTTEMIASLHYLQKKEKHRKNKLTPFGEKELAIIHLICQQLTTIEIASQLNLSTRTIDDYRYKIQQKMNVKNMVGIALYAIKNNLVGIG